MMESVDELPTQSCMFNLLESLMCPITYEVMHDPVIASDGYTYERSAIVTWIAKQGQKTSSPMTGMPLKHQELIPNLTLRSLILQYQENERSMQKKNNTYISSAVDVDQNQSIQKRSIIKNDFESKRKEALLLRKNGLIGYALEKCRKYGLEHEFLEVLKIVEIHDLNILKYNDIQIIKMIHNTMNMIYRDKNDLINASGLIEWKNKKRRYSDHYLVPTIFSPRYECYDLPKLNTDIIENNRFPLYKSVNAKNCLPEGMGQLISTQRQREFKNSREASELFSEDAIVSENGQSGAVKDQIKK